MHPLEQKLLAAWPVQRWGDVTVLVAVSGGADSVALLRALHAARRREGDRLVGSLRVAHFQHGLRPEADDDARFVARLCDELAVSCELGQAPAGALRIADAGLEERARALRYEFLQAAAERCGARYVAVGHTADDQAETILHHALRGTGLAGLAGMPATRDLGPAVTLVRPMLAVRRADVLNYLAALGQAHRHDAMNDDPRFTRGKLRHELLPLLEREYHPGARDALLRLGRLAGEAHEVIDALGRRLAERCLTARSAKEVRLNAEALSAEAPYVVRQALRFVWETQDWPMGSMGLPDWDALAKLAALGGEQLVAGSAARTFPGGIQARRTGTELVLSAP